MTHNDEANLKLLRATTAGLPYKPSTYTCITEFVDNFPKKISIEFLQEYFPVAETAWQAETPFPRIYTKSYRKSILSTLR